ncbi:peroxisomal membrane protein receptor Pex19, putative [Talaromyces stipitatus ATCC 10500]|uniref:Peroxisomal membrane protein receptor Pex19, putative n=1 Tax=Talaromyces stipitatus (strain ATCC 10500 / CBS 375.48 / QM 6759 / NRRL 1006) TaxID=441959 RepID=B8M5P5_TALSN|nr:peroxisomal membrane protein receptor Pex19, putative [Talaromyces stipitatus ATCC 10500]EED19939.1 peroxisomal membrane protein receptor Pex19, putative [Talaromyces stipitatus ATCC 10500]
MASTDQAGETADKRDEQKTPLAVENKAELEVNDTTKLMTDDEGSEWEDLDEVLDDFSGPKRPTQSTASLSSKPSHSQNDASEDAFMKQLEADMLAQLLGAGGEPSGEGKENAAAPTTKQTEKGALLDDLSFLQNMSEKDLDKFGELLESEGGMTKIVQELFGSDGPPAGDSTKGKDKPVTAAGEPFQDTIQRTLDRMKESGDKITVEAQTNQDKLIDASVMKLMEIMNETATSGGSFNIEEVFSDIIKEMSNKEMLYEPMKEYNVKYGPWLEENKATLSSEDYERFEKQAGVVKKIVERFEAEDYTDEKPECLASIWDLMQQMEACGPPPEDLIKGSMGDGVLPSLTPFLDRNEPEGDKGNKDPDQIPPPECNPQ